MYIDQAYAPNAVVANVVMFDVTFGLVGDFCLGYKYGYSLDHAAWISYEGCFDVDRDGSADRSDRRSSHTNDNQRYKKTLHCACTLRMRSFVFAALIFATPRIRRPKGFRVRKGLLFR